MNAYQNFAHQLYDMGLNVTAITSGKKPGHGWKKFENARQTLDQVNAFPWLDATGVGVISGVGGLRVFDFDEKRKGYPPVDLATVTTVLQKLELPTAYPWLWRSGSGNGWGLAVLCSDAIPTGVLSSNGRGPGVFVAPGRDFDHLELRWRGCQTLLPPSAHPEGPGYVWQNGTPTAPPATVAVARVIAAFQAVTLRPQSTSVKSARERQTVTGDLATAQDALSHLNPWDGPYDWWVDILMALHSEFPGPDGLAVAEAWGDGKEGEIAAKWRTFSPDGGITIGTLYREAENHGWVPPWRSRGNGITAQVPDEPPDWPDYTPTEPSALDAAPEPPAWLADDAPAERLDATPRPPVTPKPNSSAKAKTPLQVLSIRDLLTRSWPEPTWAVPGLLPVGLTVLAGRPKIGKSWLCLQLMQSVATGGVFLGREVERGPVLYLALEDPPRRLAERAKLQGWEDLDAQAGFVPVGSFRRGDGRQLAEIIRSGGYRLVIVDTLARAFSADKDSGDDMTTALTPIQEAAHASNCAVVLIHHHNKLGAATTGAADGINDPDPLVNLQGSISIGGMADCIMGMYRQKDKRGVLLTGFGRDVEEYSLSMTFDRVTRCWQAVDATAPKVTDERAVILETLRDLGPSTLTELNKVLETDKGNLYKRLQNMVNLGMLDRDSKGLYSVPEI